MGENKKREKSFLVEASIISLSNLAVKLIGVLFKIPLSRILDESMGIFNAAYSVYAMLYMVSTAGLPVAISRLVAASAKRGKEKEVNRIFKMAMYLFGAVGLACTLFMFVFADEIAVWSEHRDSALAMRVIAPTLFTVCVSSAIRGYYQGLKNMVPTAISQFIEAFFKLVLGLGGALWASSKGFSQPVQAAYAVSGLTVGVFLGMLFLGAYKFFSKKQWYEKLDDSTERYRAIGKKLVFIAIPVTLTSSALYLSQFLDTLVIKKCLMGAGYADAVAGQLYSSYTTLAISISDLLPSTLVFPIAISILPAVAGALAVKNTKEANGFIYSSLRISGLIALPCAAMLCVLARPCIALIYGSDWGKAITLLNGETVNAIDVAAPALSILALGIFFISMVSTTNALLQAVGKVYLPTVSVGAGVFVLIVSEVLLVSNPSVGIFGAPISSILCYATAYIFNAYFLKKHTGVNASPVGLFLKPLGAAGLCFAACFGTFRLTEMLFPSESALYCLLKLVISGIVGVLVYAGALLAIKGITESEVRLLPFGNRLAELLIKLGFLKREVCEND